ncbi:hypothetical protein ACWDE9_18930 [Streptomyces olivaceoviridis]
MAAAWRDALHPLLPAPGGGPIVIRNPYFQTVNLSAFHLADTGAAPGYFPSWTNEGVNAYAADLATTGNGSNAVGMVTAPFYRGISTRLSTRPGVPVRVTFRARAHALGPLYAFGAEPDASRTLTIEADGHPPATVTTDNGWRTYTYSSTATTALAPCASARTAGPAADHCSPTYWPARRPLT